MKTKANLSHVNQPKDSNLCGQSCVAMLLDITLDQAVIAIGKRGKTNVRNLMPILNTKYSTYDSGRLQTFSKIYSIFKQMPELGLLKIRWSTKNSHFVVIKDGNVYDPSLTKILDIQDYFELVKEHNGRITSYLPLFLKKDFQPFTPSHPEKEAKEELWQTVNPNQPKYAMSTNLTTRGMAVEWIDLWCEIENWYGDHTKKETAEQLLIRLQNKFTLKTQPHN